MGVGARRIRDVGVLALGVRALVALSHLEHGALHRRSIIGFQSQLRSDLVQPALDRVPLLIPCDVRQIDPPIELERARPAAGAWRFIPPVRLLDRQAELVLQHALEETLAALSELPVDRRETAGRLVSCVHQRRVDADPPVERVLAVAALELVPGQPRRPAGPELRLVVGADP